jgi:DNA-directed RNA polymerase subunit beta'
MQEIYNFDQIKESVQEALGQIFPVAGRNLVVDLNSLDIRDRKNPASVHEQYGALTSGRSWTIPVYANVTLRGPDGELDRGRVKVLELPKLTERNTFIVDGNERQLHSVLRRKSGVYTRHDEVGDLVSEFNLDNGLHEGGKTDRGRKFAIHFDNTTNQFYTRLGGKKKINAYTLLESLGHDMEGLRQRFGDEIHSKNLKRTSKKIKQDVSKIYDTIYGSKAKSGLTSDQMRQQIQEAFRRTKVDPDTTKVTLGTPADSIDSNILVRSMDKLLNISRGQEKEDDRESLVFKKVVFPPQLIAERVSHHRNIEQIRGKIRAKLNVRGRGRKSPERVGEAVPTRLLDKPLHDLFAESTESDLVDQPNPVGIASGYNRISMLGTGAIRSLDQIPSSAPLISPSHLGYIDPLHTPESHKAGVSVHLPMNTKMGEDKRLVSRMLTPDGEEKWVAAEDAAQAVVAAPDSYDMRSGRPVPRGKTVQVQRNGEIEDVDPTEVDYIIPHARDVFDVATNLVPYLQNNQGNRAMMAGKHATQALPLKYRDTPPIQTGIEGDLGETAGARRSPVSGRVSDITEVDGAYEIRIQESGKTRPTIVRAYRNYPMAKGVVMDSDLKVQPGDSVKTGDLLADSSFTKDGMLSMGTPLRTAYMPWYGRNFEDGVVISDRAADQLTSLHLHEKSKYEPEAISDKTRFLDWYRARFQSQDEINALDGSGVIQKGQTVQPGQILMARLKQVERDSEEARLRKRMKLTPFDPVVMTWDKEVPGTVTDVRKNRDGTVRVFVKTEEKMREGDKLVSRNANKGIVVKILPDAEMPQTKDGKQVDVLLSPLGIPSRINLGQVLETAASKVVEKTGKPINLSDQMFGPNSDIKHVQRLLKDAKITDTEELVDPTRGNKSFGKVFTGPQYFYKLEHQVAKKERSRGQGKYDRWDVPAGGDGGAQTIGELGTYAMLSHGAVENLRDMQLYKSQKNDELWDALIHGQPIPPPKHITPNVRFESLLRTAGVKLKKGDTLSLIPQTDEQTEKLARGRPPLEDAGRMYAFQRDRVVEEPEGLFDPVKTGGSEGDRWSYFRLPEPIPNPMFAPAISSLTGWSESTLKRVVEGKQEYGGLIGGPAVAKRLEEVDLDAEEAKLREQAQSVQGRKRLNMENKAKELSRIYRRLRYVTALKGRDLRPEKVYMMQNVPVLPPKLRPVIALSSGERSADDMNNLYRDLALVSNTMKESQERGVSPKHLQPLRGALYDGLSALISAKSGDRPLSGAYRGVIGSISGKRPVEEGKGEVGQAKGGLFQDQITRRRQDFSARTTITVEPRLEIDQIGMPFKMAYEIYSPWAQKRLREKYGYATRDARKYYEEKGPDDPRVRDVLSDAVAERPSLVKRDPALHKFNVMAFNPVLVEGSALQIHPLVTGGFNADFDGDTMSVYVPVKEEAVEESYKMLPSNNIYNPTNGKLMYAPSQEMVWGLHSLTSVGKKTNWKFGSRKAAESALNRGDVHQTDRIKIGTRETTLGWEKINDILPGRFRFKGSLDNRKPLDKHRISDLLSKVAAKEPETFAPLVNTLKDVGNQNATEDASSFSLKDFDVVGQEFRDRTFREAEEKASRSKDPLGVLSDALKKVDRHTLEVLSSQKKPNAIFQIVTSGSKASWPQLKQIVSAPALVYDTQNRIVPRLIKKSYSEGLPLMDYWTGLHGARKGAINKSISTSRPGYLGKQVMRSVIDQVVVEDDCGTRQGRSMSPDDPEAVNRYLASGIRVQGGKRDRNFNRNSVVTPNIVSSLRAHKTPSIHVRSPMRCESTDGVCAKCMGLDEEGRDYAVGTNVGVQAAQGVGEPSTQLSLNVFHTGGVVEDPNIPVESDRLQRAEHLLRLTQRIPNSAVLSPRSGKIEGVREAPQGGHEVKIDGKEIYIPHEKKLFGSIKPGQEIGKGDPMTAGPIHPLEVLKYKGTYAAQDTLADQLYDLYKGARGTKKKHFEVIVRGMSKNTQVLDPKDSEWESGQVTSLTKVKKHNREAGKDQRVKHLPIMRGIGTSPLLSEDWIARLNGERLRSTIVGAATQGWESQAHSTHPIPAMTFLNEEELSEESGFGRPIQPIRSPY